MNGFRAAITTEITYKALAFYHQPLEEPCTLKDTVLEIVRGAGNGVLDEAGNYGVKIHRGGSRLDTI